MPAWRSEPVPWRPRPFSSTQAGARVSAASIPKQESSQEAVATPKQQHPLDLDPASGDSLLFPPHEKNVV